ncbi:MAG: YetF domain-containing protein [Hymenobacter sp.]
MPFKGPPGQVRGAAPGGLLLSMNQFFFTNWTSLVRILVIGVAAYAGLIVLLRASGKRTLTKMNAFDFIVTVALGSVLASVLLSKSVALADGLLAFAVLIGLQFAITWLAVRVPAVSQLVKADPTLLIYQGQFLHAAMRNQRVTEHELLAALRQSGVPSVHEAAAVVLENDGSFSVLQQTADGPGSVLADVPKPG